MDVIQTVVLQTSVLLLAYWRNIISRDIRKVHFHNVLKWVEIAKEIASPSILLY